MANIWGNSENSDSLFLGGSKITVYAEWSHEIKRCLLLGRKVMTNLGSILNNSNITLPTTVHLVKAMIFPVIVYRCESWIIKKADCQRIDALNCGAGEDSVSPLDSEKIKPVYCKENQPWIFIGKTVAEAETPILWPLDVKNWLIWKDSDVGKDWRSEEKGTIGDEMVG